MNHAATNESVGSPTPYATKKSMLPNGITFSPQILGQRDFLGRGLPVAHGVITIIDSGQEM